MLTLRPHLVVSRLHGYYAEVPGHLAPDFFSILFLFFFFLFRPTDPKSENAFDKKRKKKRGWPKLSIEVSVFNFVMRNNVVPAIKFVDSVGLKIQRVNEIRYYCFLLHLAVFYSLQTLQ